MLKVRARALYGVLRKNGAGHHHRLYIEVTGVRVVELIQPSYIDLKCTGPASPDRVPTSSEVGGKPRDVGPWEALFVQVHCQLRGAALFELLRLPVVPQQGDGTIGV